MSHFANQAVLDMAESTVLFSNYARAVLRVLHKGRSLDILQQSALAFNALCAKLDIEPVFIQEASITLSDRWGLAPACERSEPPLCP